MKTTPWLALALVALASQAVSADQPPSSPIPAKAGGAKVVKLCDNKTTVEVPDNTPKTAAEGKKIADALMAQWQEKSGHQVGCRGSGSAPGDPA